MDLTLDSALAAAETDIARLNAPAQTSNALEVAGDVTEDAE